MNNKYKKPLLVILVSILMATVFTSCGNASSGARYLNESTTDDAAYEEYNDSYGYEESASVDYKSSMDTDAAMTSNETPSESSLGIPNADKLVYTADVRIQTLEYDKSMQDINDTIKAYKGYVQYQNESDGDYNWYMVSSGPSQSSMSRNASISIRVPSKDFEAFLEKIEECGKVMNKSVNVANITQSYNETEKQVQAYEVELERLLKMMDKAETIEDMIAVEERISTVEWNLSNMKTNLAHMNEDVQYSTVQLSVEEVYKYDEVVDDTTFASRIKEAFKRSKTLFINTIEFILTTLILFLPLIGIIAVVLIVIFVNGKKKRAMKNIQKIPEKSSHDNK